MNPATDSKKAIWIGLVLVLGTLALYWPVKDHQFLDFDDDVYVTNNPMVMHGLTLAGVKWAFTTGYGANWHPLTWISHMVDISVFGKFAGGHLLDNMLLHSANTLLLFLLLLRMTKSLWPSALVAALFAWHPVHVESVAWVAERKDVLSTFFLFLTLLAYVRYTDEFKIENAKCKIWYWLSLLLFALGLMSKPMLVTLPFVMLLIDFWPLDRFANARSHPPPATRHPSPFLEKLPFFALSAAACVVTVMVQKAGGAVRTLEHVPLMLRVFNAPAAYLRYIGYTIWPARLSVLYPLPTDPPVLLGSISLLVLLAVTAMAFFKRREWPWLLTGWLWFLGMLVPVIGLLQVGAQALADRYAYVPSIGLFIAVAWSLDRWVEARPALRNPVFGAAAIALLACMVLTRRELGYWHDSVALFSRAAAVTTGNWTAYNDLGYGLNSENKPQEAIAAFQEALRIKPDFIRVHYNMGIDWDKIGQFAQAQEQFADELKLNPDDVQARNNLGVTMAEQGNFAAAAGQFQQVIAAQRDYTNAYVNLGMALEKLGQPGAAVTNYSTALTLDGNSALALDKLAVLHATCPDPAWRNLKAAVALGERANELTAHGRPDFMESLAAIYAANGDFARATATANEALQSAQSNGLDKLAAQIETDLAAYRAGKMATVEAGSGFGGQK